MSKIKLAKMNNARIHFWTCILQCPVTLQDRMNHSWCLLTCVEVSVFGEVLSYTVKLFSRVVTTVAVKRDTGGEVHHQAGQGGDLLQNRLILLQQGGHVSFDRERHKGTE